MKDLIEFMAKALVDQPEEVEITETETDQGIEYNLKVDKTDIGKVIGKHGRTVSAMRVILSAAATKLKRKANLKIVE